jgi:hypothetical protein
MRMREKLKILAASVLIVLTLSLGTYLILGNTYTNSNPYPSSLGLIYALNTIGQSPPNNILAVPSNLNLPVQKSDRDTLTTSL